MHNPPFFSWPALALAAGCAFSLVGAGRAEAAPGDTNAVAVVTSSPVPVGPAPKRSLSGAELYSIHCNRCHAERYPTERTAAQWKTIMLHMQIRANLPGEQARRILQYLQENSGR